MRVTAARIEVVGERHVRLDVVVLHVDGQQAEGRDVAGVGRHEHRRDAEHVHEPAQQQRAGAAEGGVRVKSPDVEATLDGDLAQGVGLVPRAEISRSRSRTPQTEPESRGQRLDLGPRRGDVERDLAAEQVRGSGRGPRGRR